MLYLPEAEGFDNHIFIILHYFASFFLAFRNLHKIFQTLKFLVTNVYYYVPTLNFPLKILKSRFLS